jgi:tRNA G18 (ribose-2'-O)-methylase SpoU
MAEIRIENPRDERLADYRTIAEPELVRQRGLFVAEGRLVVKRLLTDGRYTVRSLLLSNAAFADLAPLVAAWLDRIPVYTCDAKAFVHVTGFNVHRGCLALAERPPDEPVSRVLNGKGPVVVLEAAANADNVGGVFRNAAAFGSSAVLLSPTCCDPFYRKAIRTSMAATLRVPCARVDPWPEALAEVRDRGYYLAAFTPHSGACSLASFAERDRPNRLALLFGSEGTGLTEAALAFANLRVRIPIRPDVDSLNLAVAAGVALSWLTSGRDLA